jgi:hypothetical protein
MLRGLATNCGHVVERPYQWSQRWSEDPPVGTEVFLRDGRGSVEVYLGGGRWSEPVSPSC